MAEKVLLKCSIAVSRGAEPSLDADWVAGTIVSRDGDKVTCRTSDGEEKCISASDTVPMHESYGFTKDLARLVPEDEAESIEGHVLECLRQRFMADDIFSSVGSDVLVSVNPFHRIDQCNIERANEYIGEEAQRNDDQNHHIFALASRGMENVQKRGESFSFIVSGESGAGKTESCKLAMSFISLAMGRGGDKLTQKLMVQMNKANPILEAFGNGKTVRNNNSSRFGKLLQMFFSPPAAGGLLAAGKMSHYLLEKSRVCHQAEQERNFHIFYQVVCGIEERDKYGLAGKCVDDFNILTGGGCTEIEGVRDERDWKETLNSFSDVGLAENEIEQVVSCVVGILHLTQVSFVAGGGDKFSVGEKNIENLEHAANLFGIKKERLEEAMVTRSVSIGKEIFVKPNTEAQCAESRDGLAKIIYARIFIWLFEIINQLMAAEAGGATGGVGGGEMAIIDIFGFEIFKKNSFEQLCINFANEKLQQLFVSKTFGSELSEYRDEGLLQGPAAFQFTDNSDCCALIESKSGVLALLDEECTVPKATDVSFVEKLHANLASNKKYVKPRIGKGTFGIVHYAASVTYDGENFLAKNMDAVRAELISIMGESSRDLISNIFAPAPPPPTPPDSEQKKGPVKTARNFASTVFKANLLELVSILSKGTACYIRCIRPNDEKKPKIWNGGDICRQLRCNSVFEALRLRRRGFAFRQNIEKFVESFWTLGSPASRKIGGEKLVGDIRGLAELSEGDREGVLVGKTKIFIKSAVTVRKIENLRSRKLLLLAVKIQSLFRRIAAKKINARRRISAKICQKFLRRAPARFKHLRICESGKLISSVVARTMKRLIFSVRWSGGKNVCLSVNRLAAMARFQNKKISAVELQGRIRGLMHRERRVAVVECQRFIRMTKTRRETAALRIFFRIVALSPRIIFIDIRFAGKIISTSAARARRNFIFQSQKNFIKNIQAGVRRVRAVEWFDVPRWRICSSAAQAYLRTKKIADDFLAKRRNVSKIKSVVKRYFQRLEFLQKRDTAVPVLQASVRCFSAAESLSRQKKSQIFIGAALRRTFLRTTWGTSAASRREIGRFPTANLARKKHIHTILASTISQGLLRRNICVKLHRRKVGGGLTLGKFAFRAILRQRRFLALEKSAVLQAVVRRRRDQKRFIQISAAGAVLTVSLRTLLPRKNFVGKHLAALVLDSAAIRHIPRKKFIFKKCFSLVTTAVFRRRNLFLFLQAALRSGVYLTSGVARGFAVRKFQRTWAAARFLAKEIMSRALVRTGHISLVIASRKIQTWISAGPPRRKFSDEIRAAILISATARRKACRRGYGERVSAAGALAVAVSSRLVSSNYHQSISSGIILAKYNRQNFRRRKYLASIILCSAVRMVWRRGNFFRRVCAARLWVQIKRKISRQNYCAKISAADIIVTTMMRRNFSELFICWRISGAVLSLCARRAIFRKKFNGRSAAALALIFYLIRKSIRERWLKHCQSARFLSSQSRRRVLAIKLEISRRSSIVFSSRARSAVNHRNFHREILAAICVSRRSRCASRRIIFLEYVVCVSLIKASLRRRMTPRRLPPSRILIGFLLRFLQRNLWLRQCHAAEILQRISLRATLSARHLQRIATRTIVAQVRRKTRRNKYAICAAIRMLIAMARRRRDRDRWVRGRAARLLAPKFVRGISRRTWLRRRAGVFLSWKFLAAITRVSWLRRFACLKIVARTFMKRERVKFQKKFAAVVLTSRSLAIIFRRRFKRGLAVAVISSALLRVHQRGYFVRRRNAASLIGPYLRRFHRRFHLTQMLTRGAVLSTAARRRSPNIQFRNIAISGSVFSRFLSMAKRRRKFLYLSYDVTTIQRWARRRCGFPPYIPPSSRRRGRSKFFSKAKTTSPPLPFSFSSPAAATRLQSPPIAGVKYLFSTQSLQDMPISPPPHPITITGIKSLIQIQSPSQGPISVSHVKSLHNLAAPSPTQSSPPPRTGDLHSLLQTLREKKRRS